MIGEVVMAGGAGAFDDDIKFAVADGGTDFIVGDGFDITVAAGSGKYKMALAAAVDGSAVPAVDSGGRLRCVRRRQGHRRAISPRPSTRTR